MQLQNPMMSNYLPPQEIKKWSFILFFRFLRQGFTSPGWPQNRSSYRCAIPHLPGRDGFGEHFYK